MMSVDAGPDGLPVIVAKLEGVAVYLDNWAIIELANGDPKRRERFVNALKSCGSLMFSFTNSIELGEAEHEPAKRVRTLLDEIGAHWIPIELNQWTVMDRGCRPDESTPCISTLLLRPSRRSDVERSPGGSKVVDLSPELLHAHARDEMGNEKGTHTQEHHEMMHSIQRDRGRAGTKDAHLVKVWPNGAIRRRCQRGSRCSISCASSRPNLSSSH